MTGAQVLEREWPAIRSRLLEVGAALDRVGRAPGPGGEGARLRLVAEALEVLAEVDRGDRAERLQTLFSHPYDPAWRGVLGVAGSSELREAR
jgi:hypothetical protein